MSLPSKTMSFTDEIETQSHTLAVKKTLKGGDAMPQIIKPQPKQEQFLSSSADLVIYGG